MFPSEESLRPQSDDHKVGEVDESEFEMGAQKVRTDQMTENGKEHFDDANQDSREKRSRRHSPRNRARKITMTALDGNCQEKNSAHVMPY
jgi:hypothetical protein